MMPDKNSQSLNWAEDVSVVGLIISGVLLIGFGYSPAWAVGLLGAAALLWTRSGFKKGVGLLYVSLGLVALAPINTDISPSHILYISAFLFPAIIFPYLVSAYVFKSYKMRLHLRSSDINIREAIFYFTATIIPAYFIIPFYLSNTGAYQNWSVSLETTPLVVLFLSIMALGIWDETFFSGIILGTLKKFLPYTWANVGQAALFASFLFALGFGGWWGPLMVFGFGIIRGELFRKTKSLAHLLIIHGTIDVVLYLALVNALYPELFSIFVT